jgi:hypothetical protein
MVEPTPLPTKPEDRNKRLEAISAEIVEWLRDRVFDNTCPLHERIDAANMLLRYHTNFEMD